MSLDEVAYQKLIKKYYLEVEWSHSFYPNNDKYYATMDTRIPGLGKHFNSELIFHLKEDQEDIENIFGFQAYFDISKSLIKKLKDNFEDEIWIVSQDRFLKNKTVLITGEDDEKQVLIEGDDFFIKNLEDIKKNLISFVTGILDFLYRHNAIKKTPCIEELNDYAEMFTRKLSELEAYNVKVGIPTHISKII